MADAPELKRGLFGYRARDVDELFQARERMFERVTDEASRLRTETDELRRDLERAREQTRTSREETETIRTELNGVREELDRVRGEIARLEEVGRDAETRATGLESELREARREVAAHAERLRMADATEADLRTRLDQASALTPGDARELGAVLEATREAIARIMDGARRSAEEDLGRIRRSRNDIQADLDRVLAWRGRVEPLARGIADSIGIAQAHMEQTAERVGEALRPMSEALVALGSLMDDLMRTAPDPLAETTEPVRVDLVSHEQERERAEAQAEAVERTEPVGEPQAEPVERTEEAPAGVPSGPEPWR